MNPTKFDLFLLGSMFFAVGMENPNSLHGIIMFLACGVQFFRLGWLTAEEL